MSYTIYSTDGFIIEQKPSKDADISLLVFTEQFGLIFAVATGARYLKSKLRYSLQSLSFSNISLVKGREVWRVTSAKKLISLYDRRLPIEYRALFARLLAGLVRFCPREQIEDSVFRLLKSLSRLIFSDHKNLVQYQGGAIVEIEYIYLLNLLYYLGYVVKNEDQAISEFISTNISSNMIKNATAYLSEIEKVVNKAIEASHL